MCFFKSLDIKAGCDSNALFTFDLNYLMECMSELECEVTIPTDDLEVWARDQIALLYKTQTDFVSIEIEQYLSCFEVTKHRGEGIILFFNNTIH